MPRHTLDVCMKYSYVPQTEAPYKLDKSYPDIDWAEEPQKVAFLYSDFGYILVIVLLLAGNYCDAAFSLHCSSGQPQQDCHWGDQLE